jgi:hypothetical protein
VRLQDLFVCFEGVDEQRFLVAQPEVADKRSIWPGVVPFQVETNWGRLKEELEELAKEGVIVLSISASNSEPRMLEEC